MKVIVTRSIDCSPTQLLEFVMDVERYTIIDDKIGPIFEVDRHGLVCEFTFRPRLPGIPGLGPTTVSRMVLTPGERIDISLAPPPRNRISRRLATFGASFACVPEHGGTRLTRMFSIEFPPPLRWILEPVLRRTLRPDVEYELDGVAATMRSAAS